MTSAKPPRGESRAEPRADAVRSRPTAAEREAMAGSVRIARTLALAALALAVLGIGVAAWSLLAPADDCQRAAWDVDPETGDLPAGWTVAAVQYDLARKTMSLVGPVPADELTAPAQVITTITCFATGAEEAVERSKAASEAADQVVVDRPDLGDQAFEAEDYSGATFLQLRSGRLVVYLASSAETSPAEVDAIASAFDLALGGDGGEIASAAPEPSDDLGIGSFEPEPEPEPSAEDPGSVAPDLEAMLPAQVGDVELIVESVLGGDFLQDDAGSRAVLAVLREAGLVADDLRLAQAYDAAVPPALSVLAITVDGLPVARTREMVLDVWLAATGPGVRQDDVTLAGREFTRVDYGDGGEMSWVGVQDDAVIVIGTADEALAEATAAARP